MQITLNGEQREFAEGATLADLVSSMNPIPPACAAAVNGEFVPHASYGQTRLQAGDEVEIVSPRQGG